MFYKGNIWAENIDTIHPISGRVCKCATDTTKDKNIDPLHGMCD